jgi:hypothetical protein
MEPLVWAYSPLPGNRRLSQLVKQRLGLFKDSGIEPFDTVVRRPALQRARKKVEEGMVGFVNVKTDYRARATTVRFSSRET